MNVLDFIFIYLFMFYLLLNLFPENILFYFPSTNINLDLCFSPSPLPNWLTQKYIQY